MTINKNNSKSYWYNFTTKTYELREIPDDFIDYIKDGVARDLYKLLIETGKLPIEAAIHVYELQAVVSK